MHRLIDLVLARVGAEHQVLEPCVFEIDEIVLRQQRVALLNTRRRVNDLPLLSGEQLCQAVARESKILVFETRPHKGGFAITPR